MEANDPSVRDLAQKRLVLLLVGQRRFQEAADIGTGLIARGVLDYGAIIYTMLALNFLDRVEAARDTLLLVEKGGHPLEEEAYQMACFESRLGEFRKAFGWLVSEFRRSTEYYARCFQDSDLAPLWPWIRDYRPPLDEAHLLIETAFKDVCAAGLDKNVPVELSPADIDTMPEAQRGLFRFDFESGYFVLNPSAVANEPAAAAEFEGQRKAQFESVADCIKNMHQNAADVVLDAQAGYAVEHAKWGNHLGARFHILRALRFKPALMGRFSEMLN